jgi:hypothetical protein
MSVCMFFTADAKQVLADEERGRKNLSSASSSQNKKSSKKKFINLQEHSRDGETENGQDSADDL